MTDHVPPTDTDLAVLLHITTADDWHAAEAAGSYRAPSLDSEGFIHLSTPEQVLVPANERYAGRSDLILLLIDPNKLEHTLVYEDSYGSGIEFPHLYGPLNPDAVMDTVLFPSRADGQFDLPRWS